VLVLLGLGAGVLDAWSGFGKRAEGARLARIEASPQWHDGQFENPQPLQNDTWGMFTGLLSVSPHVAPTRPLPTAPNVRQTLARPPSSGLRATWFGHSSALLELDGVRVLTDPIWSRRASPVSWAGPERWYAPPLELGALPSIDAVLISHDHYDHLDQASVVALNRAGTKFIVPLGIGAHLAYWGVPESRIVELDWWQRTRVGAIEVVSTPARHASGRALLDYGAKLWTGYALLGKAARVYYSGDTGLFPALAEIGARLGPFDLTLIEVGQYDRAWPDWHLGPEQAVRAHQMVRGRVLLPVHWGTFALAYHGWTEPIERTLAAGRIAQVPVAVPLPGESFEPARGLPAQRWWPSLPWNRADQHPIVASQMQ